MDGKNLKVKGIILWLIWLKGTFEGNEHKEKLETPSTKIEKKINTKKIIKWSLHICLNITIIIGKNVYLD